MAVKHGPVVRATQDQLHSYSIQRRLAIGRNSRRPVK
jgi:hypothetical protein